MIGHDIFYERLNEFCHKCDFWSNRCRKGHLSSSATGCPVKKFPPVNGADYDPDTEPEEDFVSLGCCGQSEKMQDLSPIQVAANFAKSMIRWNAEGRPIVPDNIHADRQRNCNPCPNRKKFWCKLCKCIIKLKTKLATEVCPDIPPRWR